MPPRRGRPPKFEDHDKQTLLEEFEQYIAETDVPIVARFAANKGLAKQYFHDHEEFTDAIKKCMTKKEAALEEGALFGTLKDSMAIFSLKANHGWKDREAKVIFVDPRTLTDEELKKAISDG